MFANRRAVIVPILGALIAVFSVEKMQDVAGATADGDYSASRAALGSLFEGNGAKPRIRKVNLDDNWGGATGKPPKLPTLTPQPRPTPPSQGQTPPPRPAPPVRRDPPEIPKLPKSVIPGTSARA